MTDSFNHVDTDVAIVGGGPVGGTLALALAHAAPTLKVMVLEAQSDFTARPDTRTLALSHGSRLILERVGIWQQLSTFTPITQIHISQRGSFGRALLDAQDAGLPALGYVIPYAELHQALHAALSAGSVHYITGAQVTEVVPGQDIARVSYERQGAHHDLSTRLITVADGGRSLQGIAGITRSERDYQQTAVVCPVQTELPHRNLAYERFTDEGPAALLPSGDRYALVWTTTPQRAPAILGWGEAEFLERLHAHFGDRQGRFLAAGPRHSFPLALRTSQPLTLDRLVLVGNAAQMLHPVAGQGFNMGLRDAWELAQAIRAESLERVGSPAMLKTYVAGRRWDTRGGIGFTDFLVRGFSNDLPGLRTARSLALSALDVLPWAKSFVLRRMSFGAKG